MAAGAGGVGGGGVDFFVSYTGVDQGWAEWIAWRLEEAGYQVLIQAWDFAAGSQFVHEMHAAAQRTQRTVAVLSAAYLRSAYAEAEWQAAWAADPRGEQRRLLVIRVEDCDRPGLLHQRVSVDLFGITEDQARDRLLAAARRERGKPSQAPAFPGNAGAATGPAPAFPGAMPSSNLPPRNPCFTGRVGVLEELGSRLAAGPVAVLAVRGLGGVGKSQVALEYAHRGLAGDRYELVWWVRAETPLIGAEDLAALAPALGLPAGRDQEETVAAVRAALAGRDGWLLVLDNAPTAAAVRGWLPGGSGHVLITSRDRGWGGVATAVDVELFRRSESIDYLRQRLGRADPDAKRLAGAVGDLPLALAQAAGYLEVHGGLSIRRYLDLYADRQGAGRLLAEGIDGYPHSVATTWLIHLIHLTDHHGAGLELLRLCAHLDPDDINLSLLLSEPDLLAGPLTGRLTAAAGDPAGREEVIGALTRTGLLTRLDDDRVRIHRLVAQVTRHHLTTDTDVEDPDRESNPPAASWARHAVTILGGLFPDQPWEPATWATCGQLAAHAATVVDHTTDTGAPTGDAGRVLGKLGQYLQSRAEYQQARTTLQRALAIFEAVYGPDHPEVALTLGNLGIVQRQLGELPAARTTLQRALAIFETAYRSDHPDVARTLGNLGNLQLQLGELPAARTTLQRAIAIFETAYGPDHPDVARTLGNLGNVHAQLGELSAARTTLQRALAIKEAVYGPDHPEVAIALGGLGNIQRQSGELPAARTTLQRALAIKEAVYGPDHPEVAIALGGLGIIQEQLGELPAARLTLQRALAIKEAVYGPDHPDVARTLGNLGIVQRQLGELPAARTTQQRALAIFEAAYGPNHPEVASTLANLGNVQRQLGELPAARTSLERALAVFETVYGPDHSYTAMARQLLKSL